MGAPYNKRVAEKNERSDVFVARRQDFHVTGGR
jgi:hypothetical protein